MRRAAVRADAATCEKRRNAGPPAGRALRSTGIRVRRPPMHVRQALAATTALIFVQGFALTESASAEIKEMKISVIAAPSNVNAWKQVQKPFYEGELTKASGGKITVKVTPHDIAGIGQ